MDYRRNIMLNGRKKKVENYEERYKEFHKQK